MKARQVFSFSAGPATVSRDAMAKAHAEFYNHNNTGMSVMDMSHRGKDYTAIHQRAKAAIKELLNVPDNYKILFMTGGATFQNAMIPMNLLGDKKTGSYAVTGSWSKKCFEEGKKYMEAPHTAASSADVKFQTLPREFNVDGEAAYFCYCDNETIQGVEYDQVPKVPENIPIVCDMSSNLMSKPIDVSKYGMIYAGAQKNLGATGVTIVIIRDDLLDKEMKMTPSVGSYKTMAANDSLYNTAPTFSIYMCCLVCEEYLAKGGLEAAQQRAVDRSGKVYALLDKYPEFFKGFAAKQDRSRINVVYNLPTEELEKKFIAEAAEVGIVDIKGHRSLGGIRISIYNGTPDEGVNALVEFMEKFYEANKQFL